MLRAAANWSRQEIAMEMAISVPTLAKYYQTELETGWIRSKGRALDLLAASAKSGKVSAQIKLIALIDQSKPHWTTNSGGPNSAGEGEEAVQELGKKEQQAEAAKTAGIGTEWGDDLISGAKAN